MRCCCPQKVDQTICFWGDLNYVSSYGQEDDQKSHQRGTTDLMGKVSLTLSLGQSIFGIIKRHEKHHCRVQISAEDNISFLSVYKNY